MVKALCPVCLEPMDLCEELEAKTVWSCPWDNCPVMVVYVHFTPEKEQTDETLLKS